MKYRPFGKDRYRVSEVGLGCWQLGGNWGQVDDETAFEILRAAVAGGVTFFDTADVYGDGRSEDLIGRFFKMRSLDHMFVATKVGRSNMYPDKYTREGVRKSVERSLKRLKIDVIDLVQTHCVPVGVMQQGDIFEWLRELKEEGKIRNFGASVETVDEATMLINQVDGLYSLQVIFNIFRQKPNEVLFNLAQSKKIGILARVPLASGALSGKYTEDTKFAADDHRNFNRDGSAFNVGETFGGIPFEKAIELARRIETFRPDAMSMVQFALRWILDHEAVSAVIPGSTRGDQAASNAIASEFEYLGATLHEQLREFYIQEVEEHIRGAY